MTITRKGGCLCGAVRFEAELAPKPDGHIAAGVCHCGMCRRWSAGPFMAVELAAPARFESEDKISLYRASEWGERGFCSVCGANLFWRLQQGGHMAISAEALDDLSDLSLDSEIFVDRQPAYYAFAGERKRMTEAEVFAAFAPKD